MSVQNNNGHAITGVFKKDSADAATVVKPSFDIRGNSAPSHQSGGSIKRKVPSKIVGNYKSIAK